ncbi:hypothetical protein LTR93_011082 [Exophiala xenobiotica]|nr:hypothetical protein LTR93_011082 [Exophiala xenobiotica]
MTYKMNRRDGLAPEDEGTGTTVDGGKDHKVEWPECAVCHKHYPEKLQETEDGKGYTPSRANFRYAQDKRCQAEATLR